MSTHLSMAAFALACSITPGPVNIMALAAGAHYGLRRSLRHVTGATVGFTLLLLIIGLGLHSLLTTYPAITHFIQWAGAAFLLYMAWKLATDNGQLNTTQPTPTPTARHGAIMQWLNPKAWLACVAGMGLYVADGNSTLIWQFAAIYFVICYGSIACWAYAGSALRPWLNCASRIRWFNRSMALLLAGSAVYLLIA